MKANVLVILLALFLAGLAGGASTSRGADSVYVMQGEKTIYLSTDILHPNEIALRSSPSSKSGVAFTIVAPKIDSDVAIQICASRNYKIIREIKVGERKDSHPCFAVGTGMAMGEDMAEFGYLVPLLCMEKPYLVYLPLYLSDGTAHNFYSIERRCDIVDATGKLSTGIFIKEVNDPDGTPLLLGPTYLVVIIDKNKNDIIDVGELWVTKVNWQ